MLRPCSLAPLVADASGLFRSHRCFSGQLTLTSLEARAVSLRNNKKAERPFGTLRFFLSAPALFRGPAEKGAYSIGGGTNPPLGNVTIRKSSRRFCCQQASLCSVHTGRSSP